MTPRVKWVGSTTYHFAATFMVRGKLRVQEIELPLRRNPVSGYQEALVGDGEPLIVRFIGSSTNPQHATDWDAVIRLAAKLHGIPDEGYADFAEGFHLLPPEDRLKWRELATLEWLLKNGVHAQNALVAS